MSKNNELVLQKKKGKKECGGIQTSHSYNVIYLQLHHIVILCYT